MLSLGHRKHDSNGVKWKTIAINRANYQGLFHAVVAPHIVFSGPFKLSKIDKNNIEKSNLHLSRTNALFFNV